jgi:hypothetical protein
MFRVKPSTISTSSREPEQTHGNATAYLVATNATLIACCYPYFKEHPLAAISYPGLHILNEHTQKTPTLDHRSAWSHPLVITSTRDHAPGLPTSGTVNWSTHTCKVHSRKPPPMITHPHGHTQNTTTLPPPTTNQTPAWSRQETDMHALNRCPC